MKTWMKRPSQTGLYYQILSIGGEIRSDRWERVWLSEMFSRLSKSNSEHLDIRCIADEHNCESSNYPHTFPLPVEGYHVKTRLWVARFTAQRGCNPNPTRLGLKEITKSSPIPPFLKKHRTQHRKRVKEHGPFIYLQTKPKITLHVNEILVNWKARNGYFFGSGTIRTSVNRPLSLRIIPTGTSPIPCVGRPTTTLTEN